MDNSIVAHITENGKFRIVIERAASSTKQIDGFKIEANSDSIEEVENDIKVLYSKAKEITKVEEVSLKERLNANSN